MAEDRPMMHYRKRCGVVWIRWDPGWTVEIGRLRVAWHHLTVWRWGATPDHGFHLRRNSLHVGKRLLIWHAGAVRGLRG